MLILPPPTQFVNVITYPYMRGRSSSRTALSAPRGTYLSRPRPLHTPMNVEPWMDLAAGDDAPRPVQGLQHLLRAHGATIAVDGSFGPLTQAAVSAAQDARGMPVTGVVDAGTWVSLVVPTSPGSTGEAVRGVQQFDPGGHYIGVPPLVVDGSYGPLTEAGVRAFQQAFGLTIDGAAGQETWSFFSTMRPGAPTLWGMVKVGHTWEDNWRVRAVQHLLNHRGASLVVDGLFGPVSGEAMRQWQQTQRAVDVSTTCGQLDWPGLIETAQLGSAGDHVRAVQSLVGGLDEDGSFGPLTDAAVRDYQDMFAPPTDGIVGPVTWNSLTLPKSE